MIKMQDRVSRGRTVVVCVIVFVVGLSILSMLFSLVSRPQQLPAQMVRFAFTVGLAICLYKGQSWALYAMAVLSGIAATTSLLFVLSGGGRIFLGGWTVMIAGAFDLLIADYTSGIHLGFVMVKISGHTASFISLMVPSVGQFMKQQRSRSMP